MTEFNTNDPDRDPNTPPPRDPATPPRDPATPPRDPATPPPPAGGTHAGPAGGPAGGGTNSLAITGLVVSLLSLLCCCVGGFTGSPFLAAAIPIAVAVAGAIISGYGEQRSRETGDGGMGLATAGRWIGIIVSVLLTLLALASLIFGFAIGSNFVGGDDDIGTGTTYEQPVLEDDDFGTDPTLTDPTLTDPTLTDPALTEPALTDPATPEIEVEE